MPHETMTETIDTIDVIVAADGTLRILGTERAEELVAGLGPRTTARASHVLPAGLRRRWAFLLLRVLFGDEGRVAVRTRAWGGPWLVDLRPSGGPVYTPFASHAEGVEFERAWFRESTSWDEIAERWKRATRKEGR
jgi:hypothetical protein